MKIQDFLNDIEKAAVQQFVDNPTMFEAVRKVLLYPMYADGVMHQGTAEDPYQNFALNIYKTALGDMYTNEELGQLIKAKRLGCEHVMNGFKELASFKQVEEREDDINQAI